MHQLLPRGRRVDGEIGGGGEMFHVKPTSRKSARNLGGKCSMSRFTGFRRALGVSPRPAPRDALAETKETHASAGQAGERVPRDTAQEYSRDLRRAFASHPNSLRGSRPTDAAQHRCGPARAASDVSRETSDASLSVRHRPWLGKPWWAAPESLRPIFRRARHRGDVCGSAYARIRSRIPRRRPS